MQVSVDGKKPLTKEEKALKISLGHHNREHENVLVAVESSSVFTEDSQSLRDWAAKTKQTLVVVKKDGKLLIGVDAVEVEEPKAEAPKKGKK